MSTPYERFILASTSRYRRALLQRLQVPFDCVAPEVDEKAAASSLYGPDGPTLAQHLADAKAAAVSLAHPDALVLGSDQVAWGPTGVMSKPGTPETAARQLAGCSASEVVFYTAMTVACADRGLQLQHTETVRVQFRTLNDEEIAAYIEKDVPLDCAGSFKVESLGVSLFEQVVSNDPTALEGLPLIALCRLLREAGVDPMTGRGVNAP